MIQAENVSRIFGTGEQMVIALDRINLTVERGDKLSIVGRSGSGKSTLLNLLAGLDRPSSGTLTANGACLHQLSRDDMASYRRKMVGIIFQSFQLIPQRTARQNVELPMILDGIPPDQRRQRALELLATVGLEDRVAHHPYQLSGGEQQRVAIARALANQPEILLADEPTGNLDSRTANTITALLEQICSESGVTCILVTHDRDLAKSFGDRTLIMSDGRFSEASVS